MSKKMTLVIYSGLENSFEEAILKKTINTLEKKNKKFAVINLHKDKFNPVYEGRDLALYGRGQTTDENVKKYIPMIKDSKNLILIFKTINNGPDSMMKGFIDKTFLKDDFWYSRKVAYFDALWGITTWIKNVNMFTSCDTNLKNSMKSERFALTMGTFFALKVKHKYMKMLKCEPFRTKEEKTTYLNKIAKVIK